MELDAWLKIELLYAGVSRLSKPSIDSECCIRKPLGNLARAEHSPANHRVINPVRTLLIGVHRRSDNSPNRAETMPFHLRSGNWRSILVKNMSRNRGVMSRLTPNCICRA